MKEAKRLLESGKTYEAFNRLKKILPTVADEEQWKVHELIGAAFHDFGDAEGAVQAYLYAAKCDKYLRSQRTHYSNYLFALHYLNNITDSELADEHFVYDKLFNNEPFKIRNSNNSKLTIGYIAPNFVESSSARFYEALLTEYNRSKFIVKCFTLSSEKDSFTERVMANVDHVITLEELSIEESVDLIIDEDIDILVDLGGHTDGGITLQIMSYKPAPIQISGIGWFDTTGLKTIDYFLTDNYLAPIGHEKYFSEKLLRLNSAFSFKPSQAMSTHSKFSNVHSPVVFGSFNNFMKITNEYLKVIKKILQKVEDAKFILQDTTTIPARKTEMLKRIKKLKFPLDRIEVRLGNDDYLDDYADIDIMLDTFPYNGGTMTATALYMGVPVISLYGTRHSSRFGADILRLAGMDKLIADDIKHYVNLAVSLANDLERLNDLKKNLRNKISNSKLLNSRMFVADVENFYRSFYL